MSMMRFAWIAEKIAALDDPNEIGKHMAFVSSGSIHVGNILGCNVALVAGSHFLDLEDLYGVEAKIVFGIFKKTIEVLDDVLKMDPINALDIGQCARLANIIYECSKQTIANRIGAFDGICVRIY